MSDSGMVPFVSVVVVTHDGARHLAACLSALGVLDYPADRLEIVLVDNASPTGSLESVRELHPSVQLVRCPVNIGFAGGCNAGIARAKGSYLVLLNDDTVVEPRWLRALVEAAEADAQAGICTSRIQLAEHDPNGAPLLQSTGAIAYIDGSSRDRGYREIDQGQYPCLEEVFAGCGASMLLRREMLDDIGPLEERFFMYYEDTDLAWRARSRGWKVLYVPASVLCHVHQATMGRGSTEHLFYSDRNRLLLVLRNASPGRALWVWARYAIGSLPGASSAPVPTGTRLRALASALAQVPAALAARRRIQRRRSVSEDDLAHWFQPLPGNSSGRS